VQALRDATLAAIRGVLTVTALHDARALLFRHLHECVRRRRCQFVQARDLVGA